MQKKVKVEYVYLIINSTDGSVVRGVRSGDSPFYSSEWFAAKKCAEMNNKLKQYNQEPIYQVKECKLTDNRIIDIYSCDDEICRRLNEEGYTKPVEKYNGITEFRFTGGFYND